MSTPPNPRSLTFYAALPPSTFLDLSLRSSPAYPALLAELLSDGDSTKTFLDLGCGLGQEVRQLAADGVSGERLWATDVNGGLWEAGYELFRDRETLGARFVEADVFDGGSELVRELEGRVDFVYAGAFFHLFGLGEQERAVRAVVRLLRGGGGVVVGRQSGGVGGEVGEVEGRAGRSWYRHDLESWRGVWERVGRETGTEWRVEGGVEEKEYGLEGVEGVHEGLRKKLEGRGLRYVVTRV
ncbi:hypothetical protein QBC39DRAFT_382376 [Podospora conica]|nr:hypothetical protein QBC39DRAFT_382376 [Schizothecium conicum]